MVAALTCLLLAALLTSGKIVDIARRQELGPSRDRQLAVAEQLDRVANFLSLNRPYDLIHDVRGIGSSAATRVRTIDEVAAEHGIDGGPTTSVPAVGPTTPASGPNTAPTTTPTTTVPEPLRRITAARPLTVLVVGDSQAEYLAQAVTTESGLALDVTADFRISTSLARPDYFNWPAQLQGFGDTTEPEAVVFFLGANDYQDMATADGQRLVRGSDEWKAEWGRRLAIMFDLLEHDGRHVYWVSQPPMRAGDLDEGVRTINEVAASVVASRDFVTLVDIWDLFGGDGGFAATMTMPDGAELRVRIDDGVHLTRGAASYVADLVFSGFEEQWTFVEPG
ncbi:MAG: DUF459 domain-containing protein [Acidimicrobiales bacterium]